MTESSKKLTDWILETIDDFHESFSESISDHKFTAAAWKIRAFKTILDCFEGDLFQLAENEKHKN